MKEKKKKKEEKKNLLLRFNDLEKMFCCGFCLFFPLNFHSSVKEEGYVNVEGKRYPKDLHTRQK